MCLHNAKRIPQDGEITCYKVLMENNKGEFTSIYYQDFKWKIGENMVAEFEEGANKERVVNGFGGIHSGAFHTVKTLSDAKWYMENSAARNFRLPNTVIAECVVPSENEYLYEGMVPVVYGDDGKIRYTTGYASEKLKVVRIVPEEEYEKL